jgi:hypothetical protein
MVAAGLQSFHEPSSITVPSGTHWHSRPLSPYLPLRHSCYAVSFVISNRKMPNEGRLCCQRMTECLCPVGRVRLLDGYFQLLT